jgi:hypothetical protein
MAERTVVPWMYPAERARQLKDCRDALADLLEEIQATGGNTAPVGKATTIAIDFWRSVVVGMVKADVIHTGGELVMVQELFDDGSDLRDNDDWLRHQRVRPKDIEALAAFTASARTLEERRHSDHLSRLRRIVTEILSLSSRSDYRVSQEESAFGRTVLASVGLLPHA